MTALFDLTELTGLAFLQKLIDENRNPAMAELMGFSLVEVGDGIAVFVGHTSDKILNPLGAVHGGFAAAVLDSALGCAIQTKLPKGSPYGTLELKVNYIRPITADTGFVRAIGRAIHVGRRTGTSDARLETGDGKLLAHGSTTCMIY